MQAQNPNFPPNDILTILAMGGGAFPPSGCYSVGVWARLFGNTPDAVNDWIEKYDVEHRKPGAERFVDAADWLAAIPKIRPSQAKKQRGGNRRRKG